ILVVDDSSTIRTIIENELTLYNYKVITAKDGMEALSIISWMEDLPDLISLDIDMPVMGGFEVCRILQEWGKQKEEKKIKASQIPILFVSANDTLENRRKGFKLEVLDFISKPFKKGDIKKAVDKVLKPHNQFEGMSGLVVEDSDSVRRLVSRILERNGVEVLEAENGLQALKIIEKSSKAFDIIVSDYAMPEMCGDELCRLLQQKEKMKQVPFIIVSAIGDRNSKLKFYKSGATDYIGKPFIEEELQARIETHLQARQYVKKLKEMNDKLEVLATRDGLTGLYNRRVFNEMFQKQFFQALRYKRELSCILLDIDHFKNVNDSQGHLFGDYVLSELSGSLMANIRKADILARYGGEEFVIVLPNTQQDSAIAVGEKLRSVCEQKSFVKESNSRNITISVGVATLSVTGSEKPEELLEHADNALYEAKNSGRNRVCCVVENE
ncbi:MAG: PleD family two-component system response regulator, partial [Desulfobacteraceae bacterium]|nr:PleD family two-component system response regulator [Desulfobacteraceae bacterium]